MPDALTAAAAELTPPRTNFFGPGAGADILARYAASRTEAEGANMLGDAASKLAASRMDRAAERRRTMMFDRDERDYAEKQDYKAQRGQFLDSIAAIDPNADDYDTQISEVVKGLPMDVRDDDALQALLAHKNRIADSVRTEREMQTRRQETFADREKLLKIRMENDKRFSVLTPEEIAAHTNPVTGERDDLTLGYLAATKARANKMEDTKEVIAERARVSAAAKDDEKKNISETILGDTTAFPSQMSSFVRKYPNYDPVVAKPEAAAEYQAAKDYDKNKSLAEIESARNMDKITYIQAGGKDLSKSQREKRAAVWDYANGRGGESAQTVAPTPSPAEPPKVRRYNPETGKIE